MRSVLKILALVATPKLSYLFEVVGGMSEKSNFGEELRKMRLPAVKLGASDTSL